MRAALFGVTAIYLAALSLTFPSAQAPAVDLTGTWKGTAADFWVNKSVTDGMNVTWVLAQAGAAVSGTVTSAPLNANDGSCSSCHRAKSGTVAGTVSGTTLTLTMDFPGKAGEITPACSVSFTGTAAAIADLSFTTLYSGVDSCEGPFTNGTVTMIRQDAGTAPLITAQPSNRIVAAGQTASFTIRASGVPEPSYRWQESRDGGSSWTDLVFSTAPYSGGFLPTLTIAPVTIAMNRAQYRVVVGNPNGSVTSAPVTLSVAGPVTAVAAGGAHTCAVTGGGGVMCWGNNGAGQLGDGTFVERPTPVAVSGLSGGVTAVALGTTHSCALDATGGLWCWGQNVSGELGDGTGTNKFTPVRVSGLSSGVIAVAGGRDHTCAATGGGGVACWGSNTFGQLGNGGPSAPRLTPVAVTGLSSGVSAVAAGENHSCAVTSGGGVSCWGANFSGQLGDGTTAPRSIPVAVSGLSSGVTAIAAGFNHTCALTGAGGVFCWGYNISGQLGDGTTVLRPTPVAVSGLSSGAIAISASGSHTCALTTGGGVRCWGNNLSGQLGDGTTTLRLTSVAVSGLSSGVTAIGVGNTHSCATTGSGVACWGFNFYKQLGDGTNRDRSRPVPVDFGLVAAPTTLRFAATKSGAALASLTPAQAMSVSIRGLASTWTASADQPWVQLTGTSGTGSGQFTVTIVNPGDVIGTSSSLSATITVLSTTIGVPALATVPVTLTVTPATVVAPFGSFDTPATGSSVAGSIAVTGWALDNLGVARVELWRDLVAGETTTPYQGSGLGNGKVFIANAAFVSGARPDVEQVHATVPLASRAGWGYLLLTQGLWNQGNGTFTLHAFAYDEEGNNTSLGSKTITSNNLTAAKPFGSIDTPSNGQTVTTSFWNYGWALTPNATQACTIGPAGVQVSIDSGPLQPVSYGDLRTDIASAFPGFSNFSGAGGAYYIDTTTLANGTHQIGWLVTDSCGRAEGVGSRFFTVLNGAADSTAADSTAADSTTPRATAADSTAADVASAFRRTIGAPIEVRRGLDTTVVFPNPAGTRIVAIGQGERVEVVLPPADGAPYAGYQVVNGERRALPLGSSLDAAQGIFYWQPAAGFLGAFDLEFLAVRGARLPLDEARGRQPDLTIHVRAVVGTSVQAVIDTPSHTGGGNLFLSTEALRAKVEGVPVSSPFTIAGWAIDEAATTGTGIDTVHVWANPANGGAPVFLGVAAYGDARPDIGALFGDQFTGASYSLAVENLPPGTYDLVVYPHSAVTGGFHGAQVVRVTVRQ